MSNIPLKVMVFGGGMVGEMLFETFRERGADVTWSKERVSKQDDLAKAIGSSRPDIIVNAMGKTGRPNVDWCEDHKEEVYFSNVEIPRMMSTLADSMEIRLLHVSSGCVYAGSNEGRGFSETDKPNLSLIHI
jgi:3,5-epimerase/4-reductase